MKKTVLHRLILLLLNNNRNLYFFLWNDAHSDIQGHFVCSKPLEMYHLVALTWSSACIGF